MRITSQITVGMLRGIHEFLEREQVVTAIGDMKVQLAQLDAAIKELELQANQAESRTRGAVSATRKIRSLVRVAKFEYLRPIAKAARVHFRHEPVVRDALQMRRKLERPEAVVEVLRGVIDVITQHKDDFVKSGFMPDFIERMTELADSLKAAIDARTSEVSRRSGASKGLVQVALSGRQLVQLLDAMVAPRLATSDTLLGEWKSRLRQGRQRAAPKAVVVGEIEEDSSTTPAPTPAAPSSPTSPVASSDAPQVTPVDKAA